MIISLKKHKKIIQNLNAIISELEKSLEKQTDRLDRIVDEVNTVKIASNEMLDLIDYKNNDHIIANIANFLIEQGNGEVAKVISKCKIGEVFLKGNANIYFDLKITLYCTGDSYDQLRYDGTIFKIIKEAFSAFYSLTYLHDLYKDLYNQHAPLNIDSVIIKFDYNMRRIDPKESDLELFFEKVDRLKTMLKKKGH